jgi:hypothetical protein
MNDGRRLWGVVGLSLLAVLGAGSATARVHQVEWAAPANGQAVSPDLSDDGLQGEIRVHLKIPPRLRRLLKRGDGFDGPRAVTLLRQDFAAVPFEVRYRRRSRILAILPDLPLAGGQYTLTLDAGLLGRPGRSDDPPGDFSTSFVVSVQ